MGAITRYLCLAIICVFVAGATLHGAAVTMADDHAEMAGGCADCAMPQDAAMGCGDLCQLPPAAFPRPVAFAAIAGRLPQPSSEVELPNGRFGLPEPHPPKSSVTA